MSLAPPDEDETVSEPQHTETLADAIEAAYRTNPDLAARRYALRATDEKLGQALAELRPTAELSLSGNYSRTVPGRITQASRPLADQLRSPTLTNNSLVAEAKVDQPLYTGGKASADINASEAAIRAGRASLRGAEGDLLLALIEAYVDVRRSNRSLLIRRANLQQIERILDEVRARRTAGELTRTDAAQAEVQRAAAQAQYQAAEEELEQARASYAALTGRNAGRLAQEPPLPQLPGSIDEAFAIADSDNPDLVQARHTALASAERIAAARAEARPRLSLRGTASLFGPALPFYLYNDDQQFRALAVLTIPLSQGVRVGALVGEAKDRNASDWLTLEATRRQVVERVIGAWNAMLSARRNLATEEQQIASARVFFEGTREEYRVGLRSTFDLLFAQATVRDALIASAGSRRDLYVAQARLLRAIGRLEARALLTGTSLYDPTEHTARVISRGAMPWDRLVRALDRVARPGKRSESLTTLPSAAGRVAIASQATPAVADALAHDSPLVPDRGR